MDFRHADNPTPFSKMRAEMRAERTIGAKVLGVGRCAEWPNVLEVYFDKAPSDDDLRRIHDLLRSNEAGAERRLVVRMPEGRPDNA